ncbi:MAG: hypothetical protein EA360_11755 [Balneolaceae bacterium]|nr:MAG: hypothetical protein EA360_11755 [Balneolaceae bacterium]
MHRIIRAFQPIVEFNIRYPFWVIGIAVVLGIISSFFAVRLTVDTDIANLLPSEHPNVQALNQLQEVSGGETEMKVAIKSPDFQANIALANLLAEKSMELYYPRGGFHFFSRAEFRRDTDILKDNALYIATLAELDQIITFLEDEIETARQEANPFFVDFFDDFDDFDEDETGTETSGIDSFKEVYHDLIPSEYPASEDSTLVILTLYPAGSQSNIRYLEELFAAYGDLVESIDLTSFHPEMEVLFGGRLKRHLNEFESIMNDVFSSFALGISTVILLVMIYFFIKKLINYRRGDRRRQKYSLVSHIIRLPVPILVIGIPLVLSLLWTFGITYMVLGVLNTMTSVLFVILFGLGIDYGIHYYARYIELRASGKRIERSIIEAYRRTGTAIFVSAITTALALFVLMFAEFRGFSEFGFIAGMGILLALTGMLFVMPAILVLFDKWHWILLIRRSEKIDRYGEDRRFSFARSIVASGAILTVIILIFSGSLRFEYQFNKLEPVFEEYEAFRDLIREAEDGSSRRNPAFIIADSDEDVFEILEIVRARQNSNPESMILDVESIQERFPPTRELAMIKLERIEKVRGLLNNSFLVQQQSEALDILRRGSQTVEPLEEEVIPDYLKNRFTTRTGEIGRFVIIYPGQNLADGRRSIEFKNELSDIVLSGGRVYHAASTSIVAATMLEMMRDESPYMVGATFFIVFIIVLLSFRNLKWSLIALIPLIVGLILLFGLMLMFDLRFNFYNLVVLPAILGIGCDNGIHLAHRFRDEGRRNRREVLSSTGQHITIGSLTTMLGFAGLIFTTHPGLQSIGVMAVAGIGMTLFTALVFLPSIVQVLEDRNALFD